MPHCVLQAPILVGLKSNLWFRLASTDVLASLNHMQAPILVGLKSNLWFRLASTDVLASLNHKFDFKPTSIGACSTQWGIGLWNQAHMKPWNQAHIDARYASAPFRYEREVAVQYAEYTTFVSLDDKHFIKVGEPGFPIAAVERGKKVLVSLQKKFEVDDHDFSNNFPLPLEWHLWLTSHKQWMILFIEEMCVCWPEGECLWTLGTWLNWIVSGKLEMKPNQFFYFIQMVGQNID